MSEKPPALSHETPSGLPERPSPPCDEIRTLYRIGHKLATAEGANEILKISQEALQSIPLISALYTRDPHSGHYTAVAAHHPRKGKIASALPPLALDEAALRRYLPHGAPLLLQDLHNAIAIPEMLAAPAKALGCRSAAFFPFYNNKALEAVFLLGSETTGALTARRIEPYAHLAEIASMALQRTTALALSQRRSREFEALVRLTKAIGSATTPTDFYRTLHAELTNTFGDISILVALYNPLQREIEIPFAYEQGGKTLHIEPFALGEGLLSHVISTRQPLLLAGETEQRARELGAKTVGQPAKSWLGIPLISGDHLIGALVLQDVKRANRFTEDDLTFIGSIANSVALLLDKIQMLTRAETAHQRERVLLEISETAGKAQDISEVLENTLQSLQRALGIRRGVARLDLSNLEPEAISGEKNDEPL